MEVSGDGTDYSENCGADYSYNFRYAGEVYAIGMPGGVPGPQGGSAIPCNYKVTNP
jgi:hypothetical protein